MTPSTRARTLASVAIAIGSLLYIAGRPPTLRLFAWANDLGLDPIVMALRDALAPAVVRLPDAILLSLPFALWVFAFTALIRDRRWLPVAPGLAIGAELGQALGVVPGTFDPVDLAFVAVFAAAGILVGERGRSSVARPAAVSLAFVVLAAGTSESEEQKAEREAKEAKQAEGLTAYMKTMADLHAKLNVDPATMQPKPCKKASIQLPKDVLGLRTVSLQFLARFGDKSKWGKIEGGWKFLDDSTYAGHFEKHPDDRDSYAVKDTANRVEETFLPERYMIVVVPGTEKAELPKMRDKDFLSGFFEGWMVVVDQSDGSVTCQDHIVVESSESIDFGGILDSNDPESEMLEDFEDNFEGAMTSKLPGGIKISSSYGSIIR